MHAQWELGDCGGQSSTWNDCNWSHDCTDIAGGDGMGRYPDEKPFYQDQGQTKRMLRIGHS
jgi:hypothetical protein